MKLDEATPKDDQPIRPGPPTAQIVDIFKKQMGNYSETAKALGISRRTLQTWRKKDKDLQAELDEAMEENLDFAEGRLMVLIQGVPKIKDVVVRDPDDPEGKPLKVVERMVGWEVPPSLGAIQTYLNARGKSRGYGYSKFGFDGDHDLDISITRKVVGREETGVD